MANQTQKITVDDYIAASDRIVELTANISNLEEVQKAITDLTTEAEGLKTKAESAKTELTTAQQQLSDMIKRQDELHARYEHAGTEADKSAIQEAASMPGDDVIRINAGTLDFSPDSGTISVNYDAKQFGSITIEAVSGDVTINANGYGRVFTIINGDLTLDSIKIIGGVADYGGAIANAGTLTLKNVELTGNTASVSGGAIANKGVLAVQDSIITGNSAQEDGAAI